MFRMFHLLRPPCHSSVAWHAWCTGVMHSSKYHPSTARERDHVNISINFSCSFWSPYDYSIIVIATMQKISSLSSLSFPFSIYPSVHTHADIPVWIALMLLKQLHRLPVQLFTFAWRIQSVLSANTGDLLTIRVLPSACGKFYMAGASAAVNTFAN